jgi:hypothetical protein
MSKTKLENTTDAAITLPVGADHEVLFIPRAIKQTVKDVKSGESHVNITNGSAMIDDADLERLQKNKVVARYFANGFLKVVGSGPPPNPTPQGQPKAK